MAVAVASAIAWLAAHYASEHVLTHAWIRFWNPLVRLGFVFVVKLLSRLKLAHDREQARIAQTVQDYKNTVKILRGLIPICAWCKKVRDDDGYWKGVEAYVTEHSDASFSHGICQSCREKEFGDLPPKRP